MPRYLRRDSGFERRKRVNMLSSTGMSIVLLIMLAAVAASAVLSATVALCAAVVARRADEDLAPFAGRAVAPPPAVDEPVVPARRFARTPKRPPVPAARR
jgi:hypothetical protein